MILLISGATHTGKTVLAQRLLEKYNCPYLSIDHLKMGLIRSENTTLTPNSPADELTEYLWKIVKEIIKTAIENNQNLIVEGCYIPFDYKQYFEEDYLQSIKFVCLIMSKGYISEHFSDIKSYANIVEKRLYDDCEMENLIHENECNLRACINNKLNYVYIDDIYSVDYEF